MNQSADNSFERAIALSDSRWASQERARHWRICAHGLVHVHHGRQELVLRLDEPGGFFGDVRTRRRDGQR